MATQSRAPTILLTRPEAQSGPFALALSERFPNSRLVSSPLLAPRYIVPHLPKRFWTALVLTSQSAVEAARRIVADGAALPVRAFCVGDQTAAAASLAGFVATSADGDSGALIALITSHRVQGPLLYLHGQDTAGRVAEGLKCAGIETVSAVAYAQDMQPLTAEAVALLCGSDPVIAPVFSPRTARALANECRRIVATAPISIIAISRAAASAFDPSEVALADRPDAKAMIDAMASRMNALSKP